jgi:hypothetical protein
MDRQVGGVPVSGDNGVGVGGYAQPAGHGYSQPAPPRMEVAVAVAPDPEDFQRQKQLEGHRKYTSDKVYAESLGKSDAQKELDALRHIVPVRASTVPIRGTRWLWRDRIPCGGLALLAGKGDTSKSTLFCQFVAWITTGDMKGEYYGTPRNVLYVINEDSMSETIIPRMVAHGADLDRVFFLTVSSPINEDSLSLPRDAALLEQTIIDTGAVATFIDPLSANVTGRANDSRDTRDTYQRVNRIGEDTGTAIVGLAHTRKAGAEDVLEAILGSTEQTNVARSVHGLIIDPEEDGARILSCEKLNQGQRHALNSLRFAVVSHSVRCTDGSDEWTSMPKIEWLPETTDTASDILADAMNGNAGVDECARWLRKYIEENGGEVLASDVRAESKKYSESMLKRARTRAGVKTRRLREAQARSVWYIPGYGLDPDRGHDQSSTIHDHDHDQSSCLHCDTSDDKSGLFPRP